jgi:type I restriction enzyme S subunit
VDLNTAAATEALGSLPPDWRSARIEEIASVGSGGTPSRKNPAYWGGAIPWVTTAQIDFGTITEATERITEAGLRGSAARMLAPGTLLLALYGQGKTRGKVAKLGIAAATNQACASIVPGGQVDGDYLFHFLASQYQALRSASNAGSQENLSGRIVKDTLIALPPKVEQAAIATALSDVDALLAKLDQLIAKKRDLKQVAMQQLLTGRTRLPGFNDPWREQAIGELAEIVSGATPRTGVREYWDGRIPWCTPTDITASTAKFLKETDRTLTAAGLAACSARLLPAGALLLCTRATVGEVKIAAMPVCTNQGFKSLVCRGDLHNEYLYYQLLTMKPRMLAKASGSTFPELSRAETAALQLPVPSLGEQRAIAQVLADIDDELVALEARRDKTRQLKQGMMQALLTGQIRLV